MNERWHYTDLIKAHKLFLKEEGRFKFYDAYLKARDPNVWLQSSDVPLKEGLLLFGWVHSWQPNFEGDLANFLQIHKTLLPSLKVFGNETLIAIDFTDATKDSLCEIFDSIALCTRKPRYGKQRFESTAASKILHVLIPKLFVMWDRAIRRGILGDAERKSAREYAYEFLPEMQKLAKTFLDSYINEKGGDYESAAREIGKMTDNYTLAKVIDELNYDRFTLRKSLAVIRSTPLA